MRNLLFCLLAMSLPFFGSAQLKAKEKCADFYVDVLAGTVNGAKANDGWDELKARFTCFTSADPEDGSTKCGGGVFFKDKDVFFYTKRDYIEIGPKFVGKMSMPLLGVKRGSLFAKLGNPKIKDDLWDAFDTQYGTLVLHYDVAGAAGKIKFFQMSTFSTDILQLCE
jgi:hypothetical protein